MALCDHVTDECIDDGPPLLASFLQIQRTTSRHPLSNAFCFRLVEVFTEVILSSVLSGLKNTSRQTCVCTKMVIAISMPVLSRVLPHMLGKSSQQWSSKTAEVFSLGLAVCL